MPEIGLGLGGNVGDPAAAIRAALAALPERGIVVERVSSLYRTAPWGGVPQPDYANACAIGRTDLAPLDLLDAIKQLERDLGRVDTTRWGPRVIDIDILYYGDLSYQDERLVIPHRDLARRAFVLIPLAEIAPDLTIDGVRVAEAARALPSDDVRPWLTTPP
ncbi:MAG: 2-amino-4-hydroxy-6-hydroxymethyldihydropteridine diphosphokinase [Pseudomonadota bacterium]|nr:2-amino-4-hydroxy-6-hydroxymethyldihydropteridine diphosphokinase [Pseudomonadota bacterium]